MSNLSVDVINEKSNGKIEMADDIAEIGQLLWSIMPPEAERISFKGKLLSAETHEATVSWLRNDGTKGHFTFEAHPDEIVKRVVLTARSLRLSSGQDWTQFQVELLETGKIVIDFAWVDIGDEWSGLFMKGVSDLTWQEAQAVYVPRDIWEQKCAAFKKSRTP